MIHKSIAYRRRQKAKHINHLKFLSTLPYMPGGACKNTRDGKSWYKRYYRTKLSPYLKNQSARVARRTPITDDDVVSTSKGQYKRSLDFWWELY